MAYMDSERTPLLKSVTEKAALVKPSTRRKIACCTILLSEAFERLACYSVAGNLVFFLSKEPLCWASPLATATELIFTAVMYIIGLFAGWVSDSYFGRYATINSGFLIYLLGYAFLPVLTQYTQNTINPTEVAIISEGTPCNSSWSWKTPFFCDVSYDKDDAQCSLSLYISLILIAIGAGVVRTNLAPFGGDQAREGGPRFTQLFFTGYYWAINVGTVGALIGVAMLQNYNFYYGFLVSISALAISFIIFLVGTPFYMRRPTGSINVFSTVVSVINNARKVRRDNPWLRYSVTRFLDYANMEHEGGRFNVNQINNVRQLWKVSKVFLLMIPYWICYSQMNFSVFLLQGLHLRVDFRDDMSRCPEPREYSPSLFDFEICNHTYKNSTIDEHTDMFPPSSLAVFNGVFIIIMLPLIQRLYRCLQSRGVRMLTWRRIWFGMFLASLSLIAAGVLEYLRLVDICQCGFHRQSIARTVYDASPHISMFWQIPQYCLLGASEVFFIVTGIEYAFMESPINMQGIVMGLYWFSGGVGNFIGVALPYLFRYILGIWKDQTYINCNRIDLYFYILSIFLLLFSFVFVGISRCADLGLNTSIVEERSRRFVSDVTSNPVTPELRRRKIHSRVNDTRQSSASS